jgi:hypothetical protein
MKAESIAVLAGVIALVVFAAPHVASALGVAREWVNPSSGRKSSLSPSDRAGWVNRLFSLASASDEAGESQVAAQARALIDALVNRQESAKRGK